MQGTWEETLPRCPKNPWSPARSPASQGSHRQRPGAYVCPYVTGGDGPVQMYPPMQAGVSSQSELPMGGPCPLRADIAPVPLFLVAHLAINYLLQ